MARVRTGDTARVATGDTARVRIEVRIGIRARLGLEAYA